MSFPCAGDIHTETRTLVPGGPRYTVAPSYALTRSDRRKLHAAGWCYRASVRGWVNFR